MSFTNAAIDEVESRCGERPAALRAPNFVGTFDRFINRYITKPLYVQRFVQTPHFLETWEGVKAASFRGSTDRVPDFELGWFAFDGQLRATLVEERIPRRTVGVVRSVVLTAWGCAWQDCAIECTTSHKGWMMAYVVARAAERQWRDSSTVRGLREAVLVDASAGAQHLEIRLCELDAGAVIDAHRHPFEASWYFFSGSGRLELAGLTYDVGAGDYAVAPVSVAHRLSAAEPLRWLSVWAPKPPGFRGARTSVPAELGTGVVLGRPSETDPRHRYAGHLIEPEVPAFADLSMPGYHGPNIKNIFIRMMVDRLLGAQHHTFFLATIAPRSGPGQAAGEHYHPFEEIYYFLSGGMRGRLDGDDVPVGAGDLVWVSTDATHGFVNENDEPARWLEVQSPVPPDSEAFFFPDDWRDLGA